MAFEWYRVHENMDVFLVPADGSAPPVALTHTPELTELVSWTPDSRAVIVQEDHDGDERARLFRVAIDAPGVMIPLTEDRPPYFLRGGDLHPNGRDLFYAMNYDTAAGQVTEPPWIYRHDLETGQRVPLARAARPSYTIPRLNRQGTHVLYQRRDRHPAGIQIWLVDVEGQQDREILHFGDAVKVITALWLPDGQRIAFLSEATAIGRAQDHISLGLYHLADGAIRWLIDDPTRTLEGITISPDGLIVVDEVRGARHHTSRLDPDSEQETAFLPIDGNLIPFARTPDDRWLAEYDSSSWPQEIVSFSGEPRSPGDLRSLTQVWERTPLRRGDLAPAEDFRWRSADGLEIQGWLYRASPNPRRAILYIHGGPTWHSEDRINPQIQYLVSQGFNVLDVNYRGSTGFGKPFRLAIKADGWGGREQDDIAAGASALIAAGLADPGRVGITGTSYGGYSAWCAITRQPPEIIGAAAPICGMTDLVVDYETTRPDLRPLSEEMMGGSPAQVPDRYRERSPIHFVQDIRGSLLIVQGAMDPNVTPQNVTDVVERLKAHGIAYDLLVFEDEGHGIVKPTNQRRLYTALAGFFDSALR